MFPKTMKSPRSYRQQTLFQLLVVHYNVVDAIPFLILYKFIQSDITIWTSSHWKRRKTIFELYHIWCCISATAITPFLNATGLSNDAVYHITDLRPLLDSHTLCTFSVTRLYSPSRATEHLTTTEYHWSFDFIAIQNPKFVITQDQLNDPRSYPMLQSMFPVSCGPYESPHFHLQLHSEFSSLVLSISNSAQDGVTQTNEKPVCFSVDTKGGSNALKAYHARNFCTSFKVGIYLLWLYIVQQSLVSTYYTWTCLISAEAARLVIQTVLTDQCFGKFIPSASSTRLVSIPFADWSLASLLLPASLIWGTTAEDRFLQLPALLRAVLNFPWRSEANWWTNYISVLG